jgi:hypothetical protein
MSRRLRRQIGNAAQRQMAIARLVSQTEALVDAPQPWGAWRERSLSESLRPAPHGVTQIFENGWFAVSIRPIASGYHLFISNAPGTPVRSWHDLQRIKNELIGYDHTAVEIFPPQKEVVDQANMTHLWVLKLYRSLPPDFSLVQWMHEADEARARAAARATARDADVDVDDAAAVLS